MSYVQGFGIIKRVQTFVNKEHYLLGHQDERETQEDILLREMRKGADEHAADAVFAAQNCDV